MHTVTAQVPTGTIAAIPAKAHAHRAIICAALASSGSTIHLSRTSKDIDATMASMRALGAQVDYQDQVITIKPGPAPSKGQILPHESGTTLRLLLPVAASVCPEGDVDAKGRLPERPLEPLMGQMKEHGVSFSQAKPPFTMTGKLTAGSYAMVGNVSSQFFSGLLLAAPQVGATTVESMGKLESRDYVSLTINTMKDFGVTVESDTNDKGDDRFTIPAGSHFQGQKDYAIEGDWSNAAIWVVAAALTGQALTITGLNKDSIQADRRIMASVESTGSHLQWEGNNLTVSGKATQPLHVDLGQCPDLLPVMAALACGIDGESSFVNGARLRIKESDRLEAVAALVRDLGGSVRLEGDDMYIQGTGRLVGGTVDCQNDHRLVMAGTLAALIAEDPVQLKDSQSITKSYPDFFDDWNALGGNAHV